MRETATSESLTEHIAATKAKVAQLSAQEEEISEGIGLGIANGDDVSALRDERREVRDEISDLEAALPHLERQLEAAQREDARAAFRSWVARENAEVERVAAIGRELHPHLDAVRDLVTELGAIYSEHSSGTRPRIRHFAKRSGEVEPASPNLADVAGLSRTLFERTLPEFVRHVEQHDAHRRAS